MTALELLAHVPEFPQQVRVRGGGGKDRLMSLHPTPLNKVPRFRIYNPTDHRVKYILYADVGEIANLLRLGEPWAVAGLEPWKDSA